MFGSILSYSWVSFNVYVGFFLSVCLGLFCHIRESLLKYMRVSFYLYVWVYLVIFVSFFQCIYGFLFTHICQSILAIYVKLVKSIGRFLFICMFQSILPYSRVSFDKCAGFFSYVCFSLFCHISESLMTNMWFC